jgi:hypothetical protein
VEEPTRYAARAVPTNLFVVVVVVIVVAVERQRHCRNGTNTGIFQASAAAVLTLDYIILTL